VPGFSVVVDRATVVVRTWTKRRRMIAVQRGSRSGYDPLTVDARRMEAFPDPGRLKKTCSTGRRKGILALRRCRQSCERKKARSKGVAERGRRGEGE